MEGYDSRWKNDPLNVIIIDRAEPDGCRSFFDECCLLSSAGIMNNSFGIALLEIYDTVDSTNGLSVRGFEDYV